MEMCFSICHVQEATRKEAVSVGVNSGCSLLMQPAAVRHKEIKSRWKSCTLRGGWHHTGKQVLRNVKWDDVTWVRGGRASSIQLKSQARARFCLEIKSNNSDLGNLPKKVSFLKMFSSTNVNRGDPAPSLSSSLLMAMLSALPCSSKRTKLKLNSLLQLVLNMDGGGSSTTLRSLELPVTDCFREPISQPYVAQVHLQRDPVVLSRCESVDVVVPQLLHHGWQLPVALHHAVVLVGPQVVRLTGEECCHLTELRRYAFVPISRYSGPDSIV